METTPDELWSPDSVDPYNLVPDLAAMQDTVQTALTAVKARIRFTAGTDADRLLAAASSVSGDVWVTTDTTPRRRYFSVGGAWVLEYIPRTNFTPTWTNFILGSSTLNHASYSVGGGRCFGEISVTVGAGFAMNSSPIEFAPPVARALAKTNLPAGSGIFLNSGTGYFAGPLMTTATTIRLMTDMGSFIAGVNGTGNPFGWDSSAGDEIALSFNYPV